MTVIQKKPVNPIAHLTPEDIEQIGVELDADLLDVLGREMGDGVDGLLLNDSHGPSFRGRSVVDVARAGSGVDAGLDDDAVSGGGGGDLPVAQVADRALAQR